MRVITGVARGVSLKTLPGEATRPTLDRTKQALFNILQFDIEGRRVLDAFAGSGQLGIEALSRGAEHCVFLENSRDAAEIVRWNVNATKMQNKATILETDAVLYCKNSRDTYDLVFLDPPYASGLLEQILPLVAVKLRVGGSVVCETDAEKELPETIDSMSLVKSGKYGKAKLWFYRKKE